MAVRSMLSGAALLVLVLALTSLAGGCGGGGSGSAADVKVVLTEDSVLFSPDSVLREGTFMSSRPVTFLVENHTAEERALGLVIMFDAGSGAFNERVFLGEPVPAGASQEVSVDLRGGEYFVCNEPVQGDSICMLSLKIGSAGSPEAAGD